MRPVLAITLLVSVAACSSERSCTSCGGSEGAGRGDAAAPMVHLSGTTVVSPTGAPLGEVTVCPYPRSEESCVKSDAKGAFDVLLPGLRETGAIFAHEGYVSVLVPYALGSADVSGVGISLPEAAERKGTYAAFGVEKLDPNAGFLNAFAATPRSPLRALGVRVAIDPPSGSGPFYFADDGSPAPTATGTSAFSAAFFAGLTPGTVTVTFLGREGMGCRSSFGGWSAPVPNSVRVPIMAGVETHVAMTCAFPSNGDR